MHNQVQNMNSMYESCISKVEPDKKKEMCDVST